MRGESQAIHGHVAVGFEPVAQAFSENFARDGEIGAALCVLTQGETVVDLWGGLADRHSGRMWMGETPASLFSTGKGAIAAACLLAISRGLFRLDEPIAHYWPAFSASGKARITVRQVLDHSSGLILFGRPVVAEELDDPDEMALIVAAMKPAWPPGRSKGYQLATFGSILSQVIRHTGPAGRDLAQFFVEEIALPLGLSIRFGSTPPAATERACLAAPGLAQWQDVMLRAPFVLQRNMLNPFSRLHQALREIRLPARQDWPEHDFPSGNAIGTARAVAQLYADLAAGGPRLGLSKDVASQLLVPPLAAGYPADEMMGIPNHWHLGFVRPSHDFPFSRCSEAFGMAGLGGSFGFGDPQSGIGYAYVPNRLGLMPFNDRREARLRAALDGCLER